MWSAWHQQSETAEVCARAEAANLKAEASTSYGKVKKRDPKAMAKIQKKPAAKRPSSAECPSEPLAPGAMEASPASLPPTLPLQAAPMKRPSGSQNLLMKRPAQAMSLKRPAVAVGEAGRCDSVKLPKSFAGSFGPKGDAMQPAFSVTMEVWCKHLGSGRSQVDYPNGRLEGQRQMWSMVKSGIKEQLDNGELPSEGEFFDAELIKTSARKLATEWVESAAKRLEGSTQFLNIDELC